MSINKHFSDFFGGGGGGWGEGGDIERFKRGNKSILQKSQVSTLFLEQL